MNRPWLCTPYPQPPLHRLTRLRRTVFLIMVSLNQPGSGTPDNPGNGLSKENKVAPPVVGRPTDPVLSFRAIKDHTP